MGFPPAPANPAPPPPHSPSLCKAPSSSCLPATAWSDDSILSREALLGVRGEDFIPWPLCKASSVSTMTPARTAGAPCSLAGARDRGRQRRERLSISAPHTASATGDTHTWQGVEAGRVHYNPVHGNPLARIFSCLLQIREREKNPQFYSMFFRLHKMHSVYRKT